jgi:hypothetical protein
MANKKNCVALISGPIYHLPRDPIKSCHKLPTLILTPATHLCVRSFTTMLKLFWIVCTVSLLIALATAGKDYYDVRERIVRYQAIV